MLYDAYKISATASTRMLPQTATKAKMRQKRWAKLLRRGGRVGCSSLPPKGSSSTSAMRVRGECGERERERERGGGGEGGGERRRGWYLVVGGIWVFLLLEGGVLSFGGWLVWFCGGRLGL